MKQTKKLFSMFMVMLMVFTSMSFNAFAAPAPTPQATFTATDIQSGILEDVSTKMVYSLDGGTDWEPITSAEFAINRGVTTQHGIKIKELRWGTYDADSAVQTITVTQQPTPNQGDFTVTAPTSSANNDGKITISGDISKLEYKKNHDFSFQDVTAAEITGLTNAIYIFRNKPEGTALASGPVSVTVPGFSSLPKAPIPNDIYFTGTGYDTGTLRDFTDRVMVVTVGSDTHFVDEADRTINLTGVTAGTEIKVVRSAFSGHTNSDAHIITVTRADAPSGLQTENASDNTTSDGKIKNLLTTMEYKKASDSDWTAVTAVEEDVPAGTYHVRTKGSLGKLASDNTVVVVGSNDNAISGTVTIGGTLKYNEQLTADFQGGPNTNLTYKWFRDGAEITGASGEVYTTVEADIEKTISVKVTSADATGEVEGTASGPIEKLDGPGAPGGLQGVEPSSATTNDGQITGTVAGMEYDTADTFANATDIAGNTVTNLAPGTYYVRVKETNTTKAGAPGTVQVPTRANLDGDESIEGTPKFGQTLTAKLENANSNNSALTYQWKRAGNIITGETNATYTLVEDDIGKTITVEIGSTDRNGTKTASIAAPVEKADGPGAPQNLLATSPTTAGGNDGKIEGVTNDMEYSTDPTFMTTTQISSAPAITGLQAGTYYVREKSTNTHKAGAAATVTVHPHGTTPIDGTVAIGGTEKFGETLTATVTGSTATNLVYKWYRDGSEIATGATHTTVAEDVGKALTVKVTDVARSGELTATSGNIAKADGPSAPTATATAPTVAGGQGKLESLNNTMEYKKASDPNWTAVTGTEVSVDPGAYEVRVKETNTHEAGAIQNITVPPHTPSSGALIGTASITPTGTPKFGDTLTAVLTGGNSTALTYKWFRGATEISGATQNTYQLVEADIAEEIKVVIGATDKTGTIESAATAEVEKADGPAVTGVNGSAPTSATGQGKITGLTDDMEYKLASASTWTPVPSGVTEVSVDAGAYEVRAKETNTHKAGAASNVTVPAYTPPAPLTGTATITQTGTPKFGDTLTAALTGGNGTNPTYKWFRGTTEISGATQSTYTLTADDIGQTIKVAIGDTVNTGTIESAATAQVEKADGPAVTGVSGSAPTTPSGQGKLNGVSAAMEYKKASDTAWTPITGTEVSVDPETYEVRVKETTTHKAGAVRTVVVPAFGTLPNISGTITITGNAKFGSPLTASFTGTPNTNLTFKWFRGATEVATGTTYTPVEADITNALTVKVTSTDANPNSEETQLTQVITKADGPVAPTATASAPTVSGGQGKLENLNNTMEYKKTTDTSWTAVTGTEVSVDPGAYEVRVKETTTHEAGAVQTITVPAFGTLPNMNGTVTIAGNAKFGETLTASFAGTPNTNLTYKWFRGTTEIATGTTYTPAQADIGQVLTVKVTSTDANPTSEATATTAAIAPADGPTTPPSGITTVAPTSSTGQGTINGVDDTMEYSTDPTFASATPVPTGVTSLTLPAGTYYIRVKATGTTAAGVATSVTIPAYVAPSTGGGGSSYSPVRPDGVSQPATTKPVEIKNGESKLTIGSRIAETMKDGKVETITMDAAPFIQNRRTMVPLRYVAELLGLKVEWLPQTKTAKLTGENIEILVPINSTTMTVNGKAVESDTMPVLTGNRTYLSISNIAKALGLEEGKNIVWNNTTKEVIIKK